MSRFILPCRNKKVTITCISCSVSMLHYYLSAVYHLNTTNHDKIFMDMADKLNESNDFHITPTIDLTDYERIKSKSSMNKLCDWLFG